MINERLLHETWESFASKNGLKFQYEDHHHLQGIISEIKLLENNRTMVFAKMGKTASAYPYKTTKVFFEDIEIHGHNLRIKKSNFNLFSKSTGLEKEIRKILKRVKATELNLSNSKPMIKFDYILFDEQELQMAFEAKNEITQLLKKARPQQS